MMALRIFTSCYSFALIKKMVKDIFGRYALALDGDKKGADKHRWDCVDIDPSKGSAADYIAKYVSKNMDGH